MGVEVRKFGISMRLANSRHGPAVSFGILTYSAGAAVSNSSEFPETAMSISSRANVLILALFQKLPHWCRI